jgi:hypothetical protein
MILLVGDATDDYFFMDLRKECFSPRLYTYERKGRAIGTFQGQMIACGGQTQNGDNRDDCYRFNKGWNWAGKLPRNPTTVT